MIVDRNGCIEVCVYADTLGVFSEEGLNQLGDNMPYIKVPQSALYKYFEEKYLKNFRQDYEYFKKKYSIKEDVSDYGLFEEWLDGYTCDETVDLCEWMREHNMILEIGLTYKVDK